MTSSASCTLTYMKRSTCYHVAIISVLPCKITVARPFAELKQSQQSVNLACDRTFRNHTLAAHTSSAMKSVLVRRRFRRDRLRDFEKQANTHAGNTSVPTTSHKACQLHHSSLIVTFLISQITEPHPIRVKNYYHCLQDRDRTLLLRHHCLLFCR